ncbi:MAG: hypothetical protein ACK4HQ_05845 [Brevinematales bacterium]
MKLNLKALAWSAALLMGGLTFLMAIWFVATGYGTPVFEKLSQVVSLYSVFVTFTYDPLLSFVKNLQNNVVSLLVLTFLSALDAGLLAWLFGLLYNAFLPKNTRGEK